MVQDWARPVVHWEIEAKDPERQKAFYADLFNWKIGEGFIMEIPPGIGGPEPGPAGHIRQGERSGVTLYVQVANLRASLDKSVTLGATHRGRALRRARRPDAGRDHRSRGQPRSCSCRPERCPSSRSPRSGSPRASATSRSSPWTSGCRPSWCPNRPGFLRRTTARHGEEWLVVTLWWSEDAAAAFARETEDDPLQVEFARIVEAGTLHLTRFETLD